jgi:two-component system response regulator FixJ
MDGMALLRNLKDHGCNLPIIMMTGHGDVPTAVRAMRTGAFDFIEKPFPQDVLFGALERACSSVPSVAATNGPSAEVAARLERLTAREREVLDRLVVGATNKEIARQLDISPRTVEIHRSRVMEKMETPTLSHLVRLAIGAGIVSAN